MNDEEIRERQKIFERNLKLEMIQNAIDSLKGSIDKLEETKKGIDGLSIEDVGEIIDNVVEE